MAALLELGQRFMAERDPMTLLPDVCDAAREMTHASIAGVGLVNADAGRFEHLLIVGLERPLVDELRRVLRVGERTRCVLETRQPLRGTNPSGDPAALGLPAWHPRVHSFLLAPLASPSHVYGWFALIEKAGGESFTDADERIAMTLGAHVGMAYENSRLVAQLLATTKALREHEDDMEFAMSVARVGVSYRDLDSNDIMLSRSLASLLELPEGSHSISRDDFLARVHPDDADYVRTAVAQAVSTASEFELEYRIHTPTEGWRWVRSNGRVTSNRVGQKPRLFSGIADVTERRSLELQLNQARKMEAIGQLAGGIAHDFNNLLTAIMGYAGFLQESINDPRQRHDIEEIVKAAARAASLTKRLLAFSRRQVTEAVLLDLNTLVDDMAALLRRLIGEDIELTTTLAPGLPAVRSDRGQLEQLLMNLVVNARDATRDGGTIHIETGDAQLKKGPPSYGLTVRAGRYVMLAVSDSGSGMTEETKHRLFEPFFTTKPRDAGTGLGLATVYGIVAQSGGSIAVSSELGRGSTFTVYLPAQEQPLAAAQPPRARPAAGGTETVLLAEDERAVRSLARIILERAGYTVVEAASPAEAEAKARSLKTIDLLLTDVVMPGCSGPDLFRRLAANRPSLRVLFMSGYAERTLFERAAITRSQPFMEKPFSAETLAAKVRQVLDHQ